MPEKQLLRFVADEQGRIVFDRKCRLPGRGVWITATREALAEAIREKAFARSLRKGVQVDPDLPRKVEAALRDAALASLAMANKAGQAVTGFAKVEAAIVSGGVIALVHARDAGEEGCRKLDAKFLARAHPRAPERAVFRCFSSAELNRFLGRTNVVHVALLEGGASEAFLRAMGRLCNYTAPAPEAADE